MSAQLQAAAGHNRPPHVSIAQAVERLIRVAAGLDRADLPVRADAGDATGLYRELDELCEAFRDVARAKLRDAQDAFGVGRIDADHADDALSDLFGDHVTGPLSHVIDELRDDAAEDELGELLGAEQLGVGRHRL